MDDDAALLCDCAVSENEVASSLSGTCFFGVMLVNF